MVAPEPIAAQGLSPSERTALRWYWQLAGVCAAIALIFSRQPDAFLHAQFFAEDGKVWFADAYNSGWFTSLFRAQDGYFQTLPRLAAALSLLCSTLISSIGDEPRGVAHSDFARAPAPFQSLFGVGHVITSCGVGRHVFGPAELLRNEHVSRGRAVAFSPGRLPSALVLNPGQPRLEAL